MLRYFSRPQGYLGILVGVALTGVALVIVLEVVVELRNTPAEPRGTPCGPADETARPTPRRGDKPGSGRRGEGPSKGSPVPRVHQRGHLLPRVYLAGWSPAGPAAERDGRRDPVG